jgi:hypothetical protein
LSQTFRAIVDSRKQTSFKKYEHTHPDADVLLIEPECGDTDLFFSNIFSFKNRRDVCEHAYQATRRHLRDRAEEIAPMLAWHGLELRTDVLDEEGRRLYAEAAASGSRVLEPDEIGSTADVLRETDRVLDRLDDVLDRVRTEAT